MSLTNPTTWGDWMGVEGPATPDNPTFHADIDWIKSLGVNLVRLNADMAWLGPDVQGSNFRATYRHHEWVPALQYVVSRGLTPIPVISGAPDGYRLPAGQPGGNQVSDDGLTKLISLTAQGLVDLFSAGVRVIETQNEWDGPGVGGAANVDVARFAKTHWLIASAWAYIGAVNNTKTYCISGGTSVAALTVNGIQLFPDVAYQQLLAQPKVTSWTDGWGHHPYLYPANPWASENWSQPWNGITGTIDIVNELAAAKAPGRVWLTECGWPDDALGSEQAAEARALEDLMMFRFWAEQGWVGPVSVYHGCCDGAAGQDNTHRMGLRRADGSEKPTARVVRELASHPFPAGVAL